MKHHVLLVLALDALAALACTGAIEEDELAPADTDGNTVTPPSPGDRPPVGGAGGQGGTTTPVAAAGRPVFRRLTTAQYRNTVHALLGDVPLSADLAEVQLPGQDEYAAVAAAQVGYGSSDVVALYDGAMAATDRVFADATRRRALVGCTPIAGGDACVRTFLRGFGRRAFRRPLADPELVRHLAVAESAARELGDVWTGVRYAVAALLQSPKLLYLEELGEPAPGAPGRRRYTGWEMASRLAYALTNAPPDDRLLDAAARGTLVDAAGVGAEAERLVAGDSGRRALLVGFLAEHLQMGRVAELGKHATAFPRWTKALAEAMREEVTRTLEVALFDRAEPFAALLARRSTMANGALASFYGWPAPADGGFVETAWPEGGPRLGLLGTGAFLASQARFDRTSPTVRGRFIASRLLCRTVPPPPPDADSNLPEAANGKVTLRQRLEQHRSSPACAGCHAIMDPLGLVLEPFDGIGAHRTRDNGQTIDARGALDGAAVNSLPELGRALAAHGEVVPCLGRQMFRYLSGTYEEQEQSATVDALAKATGGRVAALAVAMVSSELFRSVTAGAP